MEITKAATAERRGNVTDDALMLINEFSKKKLTADEVFAFDIKLCDNEIDRDCERFSIKALAQLAELYVGKTGIFDHEWSSAGQKARIFKTEVVSDPERTTAAGEAYAYLKASAYMLREGNDGLISEIEGGIKREVSVGCSMEKAICSICGGERGSGKCGHIAGEMYNGRTCHFILEGAKDAYEWSFVAVPAQREAGIIKHFGKSRGESLDVPAEKELCELKEMAALGERYMKGLRDEVVRLGMLSKGGFEADFLKSAVGKMDEQELLSFKKAFERKVDELYPPVSQLQHTRREISFEDKEFLI